MPYPYPLFRLLLLLGIAALGNRALASDDACHTLHFSGNAEYPPILWQDPNNPGKLMGVAVEVLRRALEPLQVKLDARYEGPWSRAQKKAREGEIDGLAGAFYTDPRTHYLDYIEPALLKIPSVIFIPWDSPMLEKTGGSLTHWDQLKSWRGVTLINNSFGQEFDQYAARELDIQTVRSVTLAFKTLLAGRSDYLIYELQPGLSYSDAMGIGSQVRFLAPEINSEPLYYTLAKGSACNSAEVKQQISQFLRSGISAQEIEEITSRYRQQWRQQVKRQSY
ncbi:amino acid ABC transporter substrate-binding protein [Aestuariirhabdus litorea]|uniref:Amino acid ABC transporter substrate-binding protein n=2 Tax=Aestuariirhabdus litorea TaxID=2528527 RepID=A0A3P3VU06_9GAMM|nr:amino acid ABC transporter substrate-binding protein [Aestuariirhabdus litorea]